MSEAVIVSTARTPIGKAFRGAFNMTHGATLGGHVVKHAVERAGIDPGRGRGRDARLRDAREGDRQRTSRGSRRSAPACR